MPEARSKVCGGIRITMDHKLRNKLINIKLSLAEALAMAPDESDCDTDEEVEMYGTMQSLYEEIEEYLKGEN